MSLAALLEDKKLWFADDSRASPGVSLPFYNFRLGTTHELFYREDLFPPCTLLTSIAKSALDSRQGEDSRYIIWIGKEIWPSPYALKTFCTASKPGLWSSDARKRVLASDNHNPGLLLQRSLFLDPPKNLFPWTVISALNCQASVAVIAHYDRIPFQLSKKLSLSAEQGGSLGLLVRKINNNTRSAAVSSWLVEPEISEEPLWKVTLMRSKGGFYGEKVSFNFSP